MDTTRFTVPMDSITMEKLEQTRAAVNPTQPHKEVTSRDIINATKAYVNLFNVTLTRDLRGKFTMKQLIVLVDALNGLLILPDSVELVGYVPIEVEEAFNLEMADKRHGLTEDEAKELLTTLRSLSTFELWVLYTSIQHILHSYQKELMTGDLENILKEHLGALIKD